MPCDCSYMKPDQQERHQQKAARILVLLRITDAISDHGGDFDWADVVQAAAHCYGQSPKKKVGYAEALCAWLEKRDDKWWEWWDQHRGYFEAEIPGVATMLSEWQEEHDVVDRERHALLLEEGRKALRRRKP